MKNYMVIIPEFKKVNGEMTKIVDIVSDAPVSRYMAKKIEAQGAGRMIITVEQFNRSMKSGFIKLV
jgi:hypothetical protein